MKEKEIYMQFLQETNIPEENIVDYRYCTKIYAGIYVKDAIIIELKKGVYAFEHLVYKASINKN